MTTILPTTNEINAVISGLPKIDQRTLAAAFREQRSGGNRRGWAFLAQIFDLHFRPSNQHEPFGAMYVMDGRRSMIPDDLNDEQLDALRSMNEAISDPDFRARVGDLLWLRRKDHVAARIAIEAYLESGIRSEDPDHWVACMERYERAIRLASALGVDDPLRAKALEHLLARVRHYNGEDNSWFTHRGLSLLYEFRAGDALVLAALANKVAARAGANGDFRRAWKHHALEAKFYTRANDTAKSNDAWRVRAERIVDEAEGRESRGSFMAAHTFWNEAIQAYRQIPGSAERVRELHRRMNAAGEKMRDEMTPIRTEIDLSESVDRARQLMQGRTLHEAIHYFVMFVSPIDPLDLRRQAEEIIEQHPLQAVIEASIFDAAGRKVDIRPSALTDDPEQYNRAISGFMTEHAAIHRFVTARGSLAPAMRQILDDHTVDKDAIEELVKASGFIPGGRLSLFVRGIEFGFKWDFSTALHVLVPQVENALRAILAQQGTITTSLNEVGIEQSWPLGKTLAEPALAKVLGDSLVYELRTLLLGQPGSNIRNLLTHGLLPEAALNSDEGLYLWWIILRLVICATPEFQAFADQFRTRRPIENPDEKPSNAVC